MGRSGRTFNPMLIERFDAIRLATARSTRDAGADLVDYSFDYRSAGVRRLWLDNGG